MRATASAEQEEAKPEENIKKSLFYDVVHLTPLVTQTAREEKTVAASRGSPEKIYCERMIQYLGDESGMSNARRFNCFVFFVLFQRRFRFFIETLRDFSSSTQSIL